MPYYHPATGYNLQAPPPRPGTDLTTVFGGVLAPRPFGFGPSAPAAIRHEPPHTLHRSRSFSSKDEFFGNPPPSTISYESPYDAARHVTFSSDLERVHQLDTPETRSTVSETNGPNFHIPPPGQPGHDLGQGMEDGLSGHSTFANIKTFEEPYRRTGMNASSASETHYPSALPPDDRLQGGTTRRTGLDFHEPVTGGIFVEDAKRPSLRDFMSPVPVAPSPSLGGPAALANLRPKPRRYAARASDTSFGSYSNPSATNSLNRNNKGKDYSIKTQLITSKDFGTPRVPQFVDNLPAAFQGPPPSMSDSGQFRNRVSEMFDEFWSTTPAPPPEFNPIQQNLIPVANNGTYESFVPQQSSVLPMKPITINVDNNETGPGNFQGGNFSESNSNNANAGRSDAFYSYWDNSSGISHPEMYDQSYNYQTAPRDQMNQPLPQRRLSLDDINLAPASRYNPSSGDYRIVFPVPQKMKLDKKFPRRVDPVNVPPSPQLGPPLYTQPLPKISENVANGPGLRTTTSFKFLTEHPSEPYRPAMADLPPLPGGGAANRSRSMQQPRHSYQLTGAHAPSTIETSSSGPTDSAAGSLFAIGIPLATSKPLPLQTLTLNDDLIAGLNAGPIRLGHNSKLSPGNAKAKALGQFLQEAEGIMPSKIPDGMDEDKYGLKPKPQNGTSNGFVKPKLGRVLPDKPAEETAPSYLPPAPSAPISSLSNGNALPAFDSMLLHGALQRLQSVSIRLGREMDAITQRVMSAFRAQKDFLATASNEAKPQSQDQLKRMLKPCSEEIEQIQTYRDQERQSAFFNHLSAISESITALGWVTVASQPGVFIKEMIDAAQFYTNRIRMEHKDSDPTHVDWVDAWMEVLNSLHNFVQSHYPGGLRWGIGGAERNTGPSFGMPPSLRQPSMASPPMTNGSIPPPPPPPPPAGRAGPVQSAGAYGAASDKNFEIASMANQITKSADVPPAPMYPGMSAMAAQATSPIPVNYGITPSITTAPVITLEGGNRWKVENQKGNQHAYVSVENLKQSVYVYNCEDSLIQVKGKANNITLDNCHRTSVVFDSLVAAVEAINCTRIQLQVLGAVPTVTIQKTDGCQVYLSPESLNAEFVTSKSSEINIMVPTQNGDFKEYALPEQYKTVFAGGKLDTSVLNLL